MKKKLAAKRSNQLVRAGLPSATGSTQTLAIRDPSYSSGVPMQKLSLLLALSITACLSVTSVASAQSADSAGDLVVPHALHELLRSHVPGQRPPSVLASFAASQQIDHKGNFGRKVDVKIDFSMSRLENGLTGTQSSIVMDGGKGTGRGTGLSLCGLIGLLSESQSSTDTSTTTAIPFGKIFLQFAIKSDANFNDRRRVLALETNAPSLCNPISGQDFTFKTEEVLVRRSSGIFGRTNQVYSVQESKCHVSTELKPASLIGPSLAGDYREIQCDTVHDSSKTSSTRYAYLVASSYYLPLTETNAWQSAVTSYPSVSYSSTE